MTVDVVWTGLRVVFDDKDHGIFPSRRRRKDVDDSAECEIVVGHASLRGTHSGQRTSRVIHGQMHDLELRHIVVLQELLEFGDPDVRPTLVSAGEAEHRPFCADIRTKTRTSLRKTK